MLYDQNRATVVYDENEEYDSEAEEGEDEEARQKRRSFKKTRNSIGKGSSGVVMPQTAKNQARLQDLVKSGARESVAARFVMNNLASP